MPNSPKTNRIDPNSLLKGEYAYSYSGSFMPDMQAFAGAISFSGKGGLEGMGMVNIYNVANNTLKLVPLAFTGSYQVAPQATANAYFMAGTFQTKDAGGIVIEYYFVVANQWRELKFIITSATGAKVQKWPVIAGTMRMV